MSVRKREWVTSLGEERQAWVVDYRDQAGERHIKTFEKKRDADEYAAKTKVAVGEGTHVADSATITIGEACDFWLASCRQRQLEPSTLAQYQQHVTLHIKPFIGATKLSRITVVFVRAFSDRLHENRRSQAMVRGIIGSLSSILSDAQERGLIGRNPVRELSRRRHGGLKRGNGRKKLQVGVDIPTTDEIRIITEAAGQLRIKVSVMVLATTGLRASEYRGLPWTNLDLSKGELHVRQRADFHNVIGPPKSAAGTRTIPLLPRVTRNLRIWKEQCPKKDGELVYVFPNGRGNIETHGNVLARVWWQAQLDAGVVVKDGAAVRPKYTGLHALRHFFASWCINRKHDGGLELPAKLVQERLGHSTIQMTFDVYGHLFPRGNDATEMLRADKQLFG
jgi:integrase